MRTPEETTGHHENGGLMRTREDLQRMKDYFNKELEIQPGWVIVEANTFQIVASSPTEQNLIGRVLASGRKTGNKLKYDNLPDDWFYDVRVSEIVAFTKTS